MHIIKSRLFLSIIFLFISSSKLYAATATLTPATKDYGSVTIGSNSTQVFTLTVTSVVAPSLTITSATVSAAPFSKIADNCSGNTTLTVVGNTCTITVQFSPTAVTNSNGTLTVVTNSTDGNNKISSLIGAGTTGPSVTASITPTSFNFGNVTVGSSSSTTFTITNTGGTANLTIASATVAAAPFTKTSDTCTGASLALAATCTIGVTYYPTAAVISNSLLTVVTNATDGTNKISTLSGSGVTGPSVTASMTPSTFAFGNVTIGSTSSTTFTITNTGGTVNLTIASATVAAPYVKTADTCTGASVALAGTCTIEVSFVPTAVTTSIGTLTVVTNATDGTTKISTLSGNGVTGPSVTASMTPSTFAFGNVTIGSTSSTTFTITNTGGSINLTIASATVSGLPFIKTSDTCTGASLAALGTCTIGVDFDPTAATASAGTLTVVTNATNGTSKIASLFGTGVTGVTVTGSISPATFAFGNVTIGSSSSTSFTITNTGGTGSLTITSATISNAPFVKTSDTCTGASLPALGTCTIGVDFDPTTATASAATLTVVTNATDGTNKIASLSGTGVTGVTVTGSISPSTFDYGDVTVDSTSSTTFTVTNTGGTGNLDISSATISGPSFIKTADTCTGASIPSLGTCSIEVFFAPTVATSSIGTLIVATNATDGTNKIASLIGNGVTTSFTVTASISPVTNAYGDVTVGSSSSTSFTITNTGGTGNLTISSATVSNLPFLKTSDTCTGASIAPAGTCDVGVDFDPTTTGAFAGTLTVLTNASNGTDKIASLTGAGVTSATVTGSISPTTHDFGSVSIGSSGLQTFTVTNTGGTSNLNISNVIVGGGAPFSLTSDSCTGASLALAGTCTVGVTFIPTSSGSSFGTVTIVTNASNGSNKIASFNGATPAPGVIEFSSSKFQFNNDIGTGVIYVTRNGGTSGVVTVKYTTAPGTASEAAGDYTDTSGTLTWSNGDAAPKKISIKIKENDFIESSRNFSVILSSVTGSATLGTNIATVQLFHPTQTTSSDTSGDSSATVDSGGCVANGGNNLLWILLSTLVALGTMKRRRNWNPRV